MSETPNLLGLDYRAEAARLGPPVVPIVDAHAHINGSAAAELYGEVAQLFGVRVTYSMTTLPMVPPVQRALGQRVRFIAFPNFRHSDRLHAFTAGFLDDIPRFAEIHGSRMIKFWNAPRLRELIAPADAPSIIPFDSPWRVRQAELAQRLGMMFMVHVADPDAWFRTAYADASTFATKLEQYDSLRRMLRRFDGPWIAAHMGGWPEDPDFLDHLLAEHHNLYLDISATKWQVRELSRWTPARFHAFATRWTGRILFGTDIVTTDEHLAPGENKQHPMARLASDRHQAFDLYASRYWALRTMLETAYAGPSPIADPDLNKERPQEFTLRDAPTLVGRAMPRDWLATHYSAAEQLIEGRHSARHHAAARGR